MTLYEAVGDWLFGASSGAILIWFQQSSARRRELLELAASLDQALFGDLRRRRLSNPRRGQACSWIPKVLLAENDDAVRNVLRESLERDGFEVVAVATAREAICCIAAENFDASLFDLHMPHSENGVSILSAMRRTHPRAVTLVLSSYAELDETLSGPYLDVDGVIEKPIEISSLRDTLREKLAKSQPH
jgi:CheY-like chemotaxis protein